MSHSTAYLNLDVLPFCHL
uniref:Uncharacterized protein n=1 Tax=Arundo donax TaxID=35708 RepID=A0A0A9FBS0_ARUDO